MNDPPPLLVVDAGRMAYMEAWRLQERIRDALADERLDADVLLLLEHPHVFTIGRRGGWEHLLETHDNHGDTIPVYEVNRGGDITYHGPGQLVGYPLLRLAGIGGDVVRYLRMIEELLIHASGLLGVEAVTNAPFTGIWFDGRKLASIGVAVQRGITLHGFGLNVSTDMAWFDRIVACGIQGVEMSSLERLLESTPRRETVQRAVIDASCAIFQRAEVSTDLAKLEARITA